jgi:hypothetical protein
MTTFPIIMSVQGGVTLGGQKIELATLSNDRYLVGEGLQIGDTVSPQTREGLWGKSFSHKKSATSFLRSLMTGGRKPRP